MEADEDAVVLSTSGEFRFSVAGTSIIGTIRGDGANVNSGIWESVRVSEVSPGWVKGGPLKGFVESWEVSGTKRGGEMGRGETGGEETGGGAGRVVPLPDATGGICFVWRSMYTMRPP